jgi:hypothetical protein
LIWKLAPDWNIRVSSALGVSIEIRAPPDAALDVVPVVQVRVPAATLATVAGLEAAAPPLLVLVLELVLAPLVGVLVLDVLVPGALAPAALVPAAGLLGVAALTAGLPGALEPPPPPQPARARNIEERSSD